MPPQNPLLQAALHYHDYDNLCVIPVKPRAKAPALTTWEQYQTQRSTRTEVIDWFDNGHGYNIGVVHGAVSGNYVTIDVDDDAGLLDALRARFPDLFTGRLEQSGSQQGFHIPLRVDQLPDFGETRRQGRPKGNRTWKTKQGSANLRAAYCQSVVPPSMHPSGNRYRFLQKGPIAYRPHLDDVIAWLNELAPPPAPRPTTRRQGTSPTIGPDLRTAVLNAWHSAFQVFEHFNIAGQHQRENDETRILGHGGLLIADDGQTWYCFSAEEGGGVIEAWLWCRFGRVDRANYRAALVEMALAAGLDAAQFYRRGDEQVTVPGNDDRNYWGRQYPGLWEKAR
jgi:hypothetical protein